MKATLKLTFLISGLLNFSVSSAEIYNVPPRAVGSSEALITETRIEPNSVPRKRNSKFKMVCNYAWADYQDSIVFPGQTNVGHHHTGVCNTDETGSTTTLAELKTGRSNSSGGILNQTAAWFPSMVHYVNEDTSYYIKPSQASFYYVTPSRFKDTVTTIPQGLKFIAGDHKNTGPDGQYQAAGQVRFSCRNNKRRNAAYNVGLTIPQCQDGVGHFLKMTLMGPDCWDGVHLDSETHKSHLYSSRDFEFDTRNGCPVDFVRIPRVTMIVYFPVKAGDNTLEWRLASDMYPAFDENGDRTKSGYSAHFDYKEGFDQNIMQDFVDNCLKGQKSCEQGTYSAKQEDGKYLRLDRPEIDIDEQP